MRTIQPASLIVVGLWIVVGAPLIAAPLAFTPNATLRMIGRRVLAVSWLACAAAVIGCIWLSGRKSAGIGNHVFLLVAFAPGILGFIWFVVWRIARRTEYLRSLPPAQRQVEELADIDQGIEQLRRELHTKESRVKSLWISSRERAKLRAEIPLLRMTLARLEAERARRSPG